ncbi:hypothetical protein KQI89_08715 [Clostridium sp. MSJ-4]|uniref:Uncharacterized protein n=1 Tax=Clostridium simiarum TaxID=2841506 RepID=A0ABS6F029_9CLOT|nr:hypothetical protein [Clostridium simiarum]
MELYSKATKSELEKLLKEYKETERCIEFSIDLLEEQDYAKGKLELIKIIIADIEKVLAN